MKNTFIAVCLPVFLLMMLLQGCIKDTYTTTYTYTMYTPVYKTKAEVRQGIKSNNSQPLSTTGKLYMYGSYVFMNEVDKGIHVIDNSNPASPRNIAFIDIPGNRDLAVNGNYLYADLYTDLVVIDISNPTNVVLNKVMENVFPHRYYDTYFTSDTTRVIVQWIVKDTTVTVKQGMNPWWLKNDRGAVVFSSTGGGAAAAPTPAGMGGSMARFALASQMLYTVGNYELKTFDVSSPANPGYTSTQQIGMNIETIFPFKNQLFIGSSNGMYIYDITNPYTPVKKSQFSHVRSCDPVIADDTHAYVTLRSGTMCQGFTNQLEVLDIKNLSSPQLLKTYQMTNPHGLSKDGNLLFICDGRDGLKIYDASDVNSLQLKKTISGIETYDVIAYNNVALVVAKDGLYQYSYSNPSDIRLLSKITINK